MSKVVTKKIGYVDVDAGCVWIGDPCYIVGTDKPELQSWESFIGKMDFSKNYEAPLGQGVGVLVSSGYGDGSYPVTVEIEDDRVKSLTVTFF
jgi:hypothetical protein